MTLMARNSITMRHGNGRLGRMLVLMAVALMLAWGAAAMADQGGRTPSPEVVIESQEACVAPPAEMRRQHAHMLAEQKDRTVRQGIRNEAVSLNGCIECHASSKNGSVIGTDQNFCQSCHSFVAVKLTCFDCHQPTPEKGKRAQMTVSAAHGLLTPLPGAEGSR
jgi:hypothetical protein